MIAELLRGLPPRVPEQRTVRCYQRKSSAAFAGVAPSSALFTDDSETPPRSPPARGRRRAAVGPRAAAVGPAGVPAPGEAAEKFRHHQ